MTMADLLKSELPRHIECFDNSNFHGQYPVSHRSFQDTKPSKKDYRHFNVKQWKVLMILQRWKEAVLGEFIRRLLEKRMKPPQLIVVMVVGASLPAALKV